MKKIALLFSSIFCSIFLLSNLDGAFPENTGAPNELTCGRVPCHNVPVNIGSAQMSITFSGNGQQYFADSTYLLTVKITNPQTMRNGFEILALSETLQNAGTWQILEPDKMKIITGIGLPNRKYVTHRAAGNLQSEWTVAWKAPSTDMGKLTFYASVNSTNNNGLKTGDDVYTDTIEVDFAESVTTVEVEQKLLRVFPTLKTTGVWVEMPVEMKTIRLSLFDSGGVLRMVQKLTQGGLYFFEIDSLPAGIYFLKMESGRQQAEERIIIQ